jgi:hypothetical protein
MAFLPVKMDYAYEGVFLHKSKIVRQHPVLPEANIPQLQRRIFELPGASCLVPPL